MTNTLLLTLTLGSAPGLTPTDLAAPFAPARTEMILGLAEREILELDWRLPDQEDKPTVRECLLNFAVAGTICGLTIVFPSPGTAIACAVKVFEGYCSCSEHLGIEICRW